MVSKGWWWWWRKETAADRAEGVVRALFDRHTLLLERHAAVMRELSAKIDPGITDDRFDDWIAAEIDRRNTGKSELHGVPASIRAAHLDDLNVWIGNQFRRRLAAYRAAILTQTDGDKKRNISERWPATRKEEDETW